MTRIMLIDAAEQEETRVAITENGDIDHFDFISKSKSQIKGNIYLAKITRIEPSLQAAFVEYGGERQGFLSFSEVHPDYYQIPVEDRERILKEAETLEDEEDETEESVSSSSDSPEAESAIPEISSETESLTDTAENDISNRRGGLRRRGRRKPLHKKTGRNATDNNESVTADTDNNDKPIALENDDDVIASEPIEPESSETDMNPMDDATASDETNEPAKKRTSIRRNRRNNKSKKSQSVKSDNTETASETQEDSTDSCSAEEENHHITEGDIINNAINDAEEELQEIESVNRVIDEEEETRKQRAPIPLIRRYKIQEVLRPGQIVLVQVIKEERGNKGVSLSTYISLAGRYCVLMPNSPKGGGISRKIGSGEDRKRLKEIAEELKVMRGMSAIIRTAGLDRTRAEIKRDYEYLIKLWNQIREDALASIAPALVYEESDIVKRSIRDHYNGDIDTILVQGEQAYRRAKDFMKLIMPSHAPRVKQFKETDPIFTAHEVEPLLAELYHTTAPLKSGGYIVINPTEALISIDVNSGKSTTERNVEETAYKTNLEACEEIARQLRLRNLGGLIVIDFIDMNYHKYRRNVERALKDAFKNDRAKIQIGHISMFGLLEMSRQRMGTSIIESTTQPCDVCHGTGRVPLVESTVMQLLRNLQSFIAEHGTGSITISLSSEVMLEMLNNHRTTMDHISQAFDVSVNFDLHNKEDHHVYFFKGKQGLRFSSEEGFSRKKSILNKKEKLKNKKGRRNNDTGEKNDIISEHITPAFQENREPVQTDNEHKRKDRPKKSRRNKFREDRNTSVESSDSFMASDTRQNEADSQDNSVTVTNLSQSDDVAAISDFSEKATINLSDDTSQLDTSFNKSNEHLTVAQKAEPLPLREDTPTPPERRKGWWQRVLEG